MRKLEFQHSLSSVLRAHYRRGVRCAAWAAIGVSTMVLAVDRSPLVMHETMSEAERAEVIRAAVATPKARAVKPVEHKMLRMTPEQSRAELNAIDAETSGGERKSLRDQTFREIRVGEQVTVIVGTAMAKQSQLVRNAKGEWVQTCSDDHGDGAHTHTHVVSKKGANLE